ncbi:MAG: D-alanine--D-alanine ligase, partial [Clostridia bacterium]|nr:D-alanine--D-alanine ligase [Clostridia bacterium]
MKKNICVIFGGVSPEHEVSLMTAHSVLDHIDRTVYEVYPVGITKAGRWLYFDGDLSLLEDGSWEHSERAVPAFLSPSAGEGLVIAGPDPRRVSIDCVFPAMHGEGCEDGAMQGLCKLAGIPCVGAGVGASAASMDKDFTKAIVGRLGIRQANYVLITREAFRASPEEQLDRVEQSLGGFPLFVKPAGTGSSVGVSKVRSREALRLGLEEALRYDRKVLVEEFFDGREIETAVIGNADPQVSCCGEIIPGDEFYSYDDKYI